MIETVATVERNDELSPGYRLLTLAFDQPIQARAGQFAMLKPQHCYEPLLRRALAIYRADGPHQLSFLYQVLGRGTEALSMTGRGDKVEALIPLGNNWPTDVAGGNSVEDAIVIAGGIGSASVLMLGQELARAGIDTQVFFGAASERSALGCGLEDFRALGLPLRVTTDDGTLGERGLVTGPLEKYLSGGGGRNSVIYTCGPWVMMARVAEISASHSVRCFASLEAPMGCGFGVCVGCVVAVKTEGPAAGYDSYKRVCVDGSIFPAEVIRWEVAAMTH
jgi:dihydroorotate dehydrogenase electron transfer subunit